MGERRTVCRSTHAGPWREIDPAERRELAHALQRRGLQLTLQREAIYEAVLGCPGHICAEHLVAETSERHPGLKMDKTTVYRTLDLLVEMGLVSTHRFGDGPAQYEPASRGPHGHLVCQRCGAMINLDRSMLEGLCRPLLAQYGFAADLASYPILGLCASCRQE